VKTTTKSETELLLGNGSWRAVIDYTGETSTVGGREVKRHAKKGRGLIGGEKVEEAKLGDHKVVMWGGTGGGSTQKLEKYLFK